MDKLRKVNNEFYSLYDSDGDIVASNNPKTPTTKKLSLKNCEAIANGYDLVELFDEVDESIDYQEFDFSSFKLGFKKAIELLGDKKFSEEDMLKAIEMYYGKDKIFIEIIQSLQQTEWDVEIVMDKDCYSSAGRCDKLIMADCIICTPVTYLRDENGCLILKRV